jgi:hypoxanthine phosphoribosyltransferase
MVKPSTRCRVWPDERNREENTLVAPENFAGVLADADIIHDAARIDAAIGAMARRIDADYEQSDRPIFVTVMQGGLFFAAQLGLRCTTDFEFDYVHATRYRGTDGGELNWIKRPNAAMAGRNILLVDDILDEGHTLLAICNHCRDEGASSVRIAVLADKTHERRAEGIVADYTGLIVPDRYVFGYGMDWHGHGRNLPAIHAMADAS